ncbi:uncharacterized protein BO88DRAFT_425366 [Aspergillus vadensis CBS 113365]|uniref:Uncharacterized protein n=1 Tax=Aspergillus vadensis (strain CBS 113365 / IMI 142717 / IBT 24658) TaxID=1448311 RepID=A0A319C2Q8_ASPVC|nr:hypothetical protein BO88DRAFT_425366 [Aspergillus vadensis CBS 113365]PYH69698.1 hypothetical protein BO88DRAFT_425366 [Aspergillus vadensis CBS 113365]
MDLGLEVRREWIFGNSLTSLSAADLVSDASAGGPSLGAVDDITLSDGAAAVVLEEKGLETGGFEGFRRVEHLESAGVEVDRKMQSPGLLTGSGGGNKRCGGKFRGVVVITSQQKDPPSTRTNRAVEPENQLVIRSTSHSNHPSNGLAAMRIRKPEITPIRDQPGKASFPR